MSDSDVIVDLHTITESEVGGPFIVLSGPVTSPITYEGYEVEVEYQDAVMTTVTDWTATVSFACNISYDRGNSWVLNATNQDADIVTLTATPATGSLVMGCNPNLPSDSGEVWVQVQATIETTQIVTDPPNETPPTPDPSIAYSASVYY